MIIFYLPLSIFIIFLAWDVEKFYSFGVPISLVSLLTYLTAQFGRDLGKRKEPKLWTEWGGSPTTQLFRWRNSRIDNYTKERNHQKMQVFCPVDVTVDNAFESENLLKADEIYQSWTKFLIGQTRDTKKFSLLFKENMAYGFRRNLWGLKNYAILLITVLIFGSYGYFYILTNSMNILLYPTVFFVAELLLCLLLLFWITIVTKDWVSIPAFSYAERLHEVLETME